MEQNSFWPDEVLFFGFQSSKQFTFLRLSITSVDNFYSPNPLTDFPLHSVVSTNCPRELVATSHTFCFIQWNHYI